MTHDDFIRAIIGNPDDDAPRLVFADWLEERGESERAEFIRVQIELARLPEGDRRRRRLEERERELLEQHTLLWFGERLRTFFANPPKHDQFDAEARQRAFEHSALPLDMDSGGFHALRMDGSVVVFFWDEADIKRVESDPRQRYVALFQGAKKYPELRLLIPPRPTAAQTCSHCKGAGTIPEMPTLICYCGGLGWVP